MLIVRTTAQAVDDATNSHRRVKSRRESKAKQECRRDFRAKGETEGAKDDDDALPLTV
jgi:hypothetical protein